MSTSSRLLETLKNFPDPVLTEVLDFAEFLQAKRLAVQAPTSDEPLINLAGGLENSTCFAEDALVLQARLRNEWN